MVSAITEIVRRPTFVVSSFKALIKTVEMVLDGGVFFNLNRRNILEAIMCIDEPQSRPVRFIATYIAPSEHRFENLN